MGGHRWYSDEEKFMDKILGICERLCNIRYESDIEEDEVAGFDDEVETLLDQLTGISTKKFQIISIEGMAGIGKTTLARKLYSHPLVVYMFDYRAWTCVSEVYLKKNLLLGILSSFINDLTDEIYEMDGEQLGEKLYRLLKGRKYIVFLDDIWDSMVWNDLKRYFPDDNTGSRVVFTSRVTDMSLQVQATRPAHHLRLRTGVESWTIFQNKVFKTGICPRWLEDVGRMSIGKCLGLPLAIIITAGLLKNKISYMWWSEIAISLHSFMVSDPSQFMDSLAISYNHLPPHIRPCFLFFNAFPEDCEIPVRKLVWLWIAQGFIHQIESKVLEDVAEDFLMELIKKSLVMTPRMNADGKVKTCRIHDLLREFSLKKADQEEIFLPTMHRYGKVSWMLCSPLELGKVLQEGKSIHIDTYKSLRILDVESIRVSIFPSDVVQLVNLRYLAIQAHNGNPPDLVSNLINLQMLIISSRKNIVVPKTIWNMVNLRHVCIKSGENLIEEPPSVQVTEDHGSPTAMASLQTLSQVSPQSCQNIFSRTPNLRNLGLCGQLISRLGYLEFPIIDSLQHLQKLKLLNTVSYPEATRSCNPLMFPENLKKLTLSNIGMNWEEMWKFTWLPNLEILKLKFHTCIGERWETGDVEFERLKVLKLHDLDIRIWISSKDNFPRLQRLVVRRCLKLDSIPLDVGKILTLETIEVSGCSSSTYNSALEIKRQQESEGNSFIKVHAKENMYF